MISRMTFSLIGEDGKWVEDQRVSAKELIPNLFLEVTPSGNFGIDSSCPPGTIRSVRDHDMKLAGGIHLRYTGYVKELANSKALIPTNLTTKPYMYFKLKSNINFFVLVT